MSGNFIAKDLNPCDFEFDGSFRSSTGMLPLCWTIAAVDPSSGAGTIRDSGVMMDFGCQPVAVVTALTAQSCDGFDGVSPADTDIFSRTLAICHSDAPPAAIKIGLIPNRACLEAIIDTLGQLVLEGIKPPVVYDPVLRCSLGADMSELSGRDIAESGLMPLCDVITPNEPELLLLAGMPNASKISSEAKELAAEKLIAKGASNVLVTGGHRLDGRQETIVDELYGASGRRSFGSSFIDCRNKHGTGCALSSAIAALLAKGHNIPDAITAAIAYVTAGIDRGIPCGRMGGTLAFALGKSWLIPKNMPIIETPWTPNCEVDESCSGFPGEINCCGIYPVVADLETVKQLADAGVRLMQLRIKDPEYPRLREDIREAADYCRRRGVSLYIDDHWQLAIESGAYGVHLGQEDLLEADVAAIKDAGLRLGVSTHGFEELAKALMLRPSYIALGHIFPTPTKTMKSKPQGLSNLANYVRACRGIPTVAIGGIDDRNLLAVKSTGVDAAAVVRAVTQAPEPARAARDLDSMWRGRL